MKLIILSILLAFNSFASLGVKVGSRAPSFKLEGVNGKNFDLSKQNKKTILVFFRGAWCPYCVKQLQELESKIIPKLGDSQLIAISVDRLKVAKKLHSRFKFNFEILSDPKAKSLRKFNIINQLDDHLVKKYKNSYKIDIEADSGETHHMIAHPAVFIVSKNNKVVFSDVHVDYKQRTNVNEILKYLE